ncbi:EAL domain-containing protein [Ewingella americana]|jgi:EAL domain-containing protein (putative c-di-GMP-specific phosphodiesterase class I)|uniref:EAL domain-containing protein n=2 Tax=Ewingella americana TaxID=41202 RepID=UPI00242B99A4|nr:EAL domain-containing protein [Ewingella americana]MCI2142864.1 EAL domain-containing protein [Ewingella americana]
MFWKKMKIQFDTAFSSNYLCQPIYSNKGKLLAVELICRFASTDSKLIMPTELVLNLLNTQQLSRFLSEQVAFAKEHAAWFEKNQVILNITIEEKLANIITDDDVLRDEIKQLKFIHLSINESFPQLSAGKNNAQLVALKNDFTLWLDGMGSGNANMAPIFDHIFTWVKLDRALFWELYQGENFTIILPSLLRNLNRFCRNVVIDGLDSAEYFDALNKTDVQGMKGMLWPGVEAAALDNLLESPSQFH